MSEQEHYKRLLKNLIDKTETDRIRSSEELVQMLIDELIITERLKHQPYPE
ncbi:hypothetical protein [Lentibacillus saliphilus]|uniref:hypothetical protein n=1 Tax=Lentibacillus saliphilus TaxID=2737028 RepID=UPI001C3028DB|nr:hypothetical protein [Lentibacillus saliphilus]